MPATSEQILEMRRPYEPFGAALELWKAKDDEILIEGPAGTGKTRAILEKIFYLCMRYPGIRALLVRKTREAMTESVLVTLETKVMPKNHPAQIGPKRNLRANYVLPNGSEIVVGGMDKDSKVMSTEYDIIGTFESTELDEGDFENLVTRLRNGKIRDAEGNVILQQIIADCNPGDPNHWLNRRADTSRMRRLRSKHADNPYLYDHKVKAWTPEGTKYLSKLRNLTGFRRLRLLDGKWVAAEGQVYEQYDPEIHLIEPFPIPMHWRRIRSIDFGFTNPFVCQWWAVDGDGRMYLYREIYRSKRTVRIHAKGVVVDKKVVEKGIRQWSKGEFYEATVADHDAEDRATLDAAGIDSIPAFKAITPGIEAVQLRLNIAGDGKPRLFIFNDALVERDDLLEEAHRPCCTAHEFGGYIYHKGQDGKPIKEEPLKVNDHGMDTMRYAVAFVDNLSVEFIEVNSGGEVPVILSSADIQKMNHRLGR